MGQAIRRVLRRKKGETEKTKNTESTSTDDNEDHDLDELEMQVVRYKPEGLESLSRNTKFSKKELQIMYRGFKQECPTGIVNEDTFKEIYGQFFPQGDSNQYAHYVFKSFDQGNNGSITFEEFIMGLSVLSRGTLHDKLQWAFNLYDINGDGLITKDEMLDIVTSIYDMMGKHSEPAVDDHTAKEHVEKLFQKMDLNHDGIISMDEFMETCRRDKSIMNCLPMLDTDLCVDDYPSSPTGNQGVSQLSDSTVPPVDHDQVNIDMPHTAPPAGDYSHCNNNNNTQDAVPPVPHLC